MVIEYEVSQRFSHAGLFQGVPVEADARNFASGESLPEPAEGAVVLVDDGH